MIGETVTRTAKSLRSQPAQRLLRAATASIAALTSLQAVHAATDVTWLGGNSSWGDTTKWSGGVVPLNSGSNTFNVFVPVTPAANIIAVNYGNIHTTSIDTLTLNSGTINIEDTDRLDVVNHVAVNSGHININGATSFTTFSLIGGGTISGGGVITMGNNANNHIRTETPGSRITNVDNLIQGSGNIAGDQSMALTNSGTILANQTVPLKFLPGFGTTNVNTSWFRATNSAELQISSSATLNNSGGTIAATNGGIVTLLGAIKVIGGTLTSDGTSVIRSGSSGTTSIPQLINLTNAGHLQIPDGKAINIQQTINNTGSITLDASSGANTDLIVSGGSVTLSGGGLVQMTIPGSRIYGLPSAVTTLINQDNTISGTGLLGNNALNFTNSGTVLGTGGRGLMIDPVSSAINDTTGLWAATAGGLLVLTGAGGSSSFSNNGSMSVASGGTLVLNSAASLTGNGIFNDGRITIGGSMLNINSITGAGVTSLTSGSSAKLNFIRGNGLLVGNASLSINANGTAANTSLVTSLSITGAGSVDLHDNDLIIDYTGASPVDSVRTFIGTGSLMSSEAAASTSPKTALGYADNMALGLSSFSGQTVDATSVLVKYTYAGDANLDGQVDVADLGALAGHWQATGLWNDGDFNYDAFVDVTDLGLLAGNWQAGTGNPLSVTFEQALANVGLAVPEPSILAVAMMAAMTTNRSRWRRR